jgi:hypothetical protein
MRVKWGGAEVIPVFAIGPGFISLVANVSNGSAISTRFSGSAQGLL